MIGTSSPIITNILKGKISAVDPKFYITTTIPLGVAIALLSGIGQLLWWGNSKSETLLRQLIAPVILAAVFTLVTYFMGAVHVTMLIFIFASSFALFTNLIVGYKIIQGNPKMAGGSLAHVGIAFMFLGFVASAKYDDVKTLNLEQGKEVEALGYKLKYVGYEARERGRYGFNVEVEKDGEKFVVSPVMFQEGENASLIRNPDIINMITKDFYVSPLSLESGEQSAHNHEITINKGNTEKYNGLQIKYLGYDFTQTKEKGNYLVVNLEVLKDGKKYSLKPTMTNSGGQPKYENAVIAGTEITIGIKVMKPGDGEQASVTLSVDGIHEETVQQTKKVDTLVVEASIKPYINLVWIGTFALIGGFLITIFRRIQEVNMKK